MSRERAPSVRAPEFRADVERLFELLDDDPNASSIDQWASRNLKLYNELANAGLIDTKIVPANAHRFLTTELISNSVPAALDPQNAGHVRAQNENIIDLALSMDLGTRTFTICLEAGFIHDLNKAPDEKLRRDRYGVRDAAGGRVPEIRSTAAVVGLNHLGERTRRTLEQATRIGRGELDDEVAGEIDLCIVHHGLGSSSFIRQLIDGDNPWWGSEFVDPRQGIRKLIHPAPPALTLASTVHDIADSLQQMQAGVAWLTKYPEGFWKDSGRSIADMLSGRPDGRESGIPVSLLQQTEVELSVCESILADSIQHALVRPDEARALRSALERIAAMSREWIDDAPENLDRSRGRSVYHDVARALNVTPTRAKEILAKTKVGGPRYARLRELIRGSARKVDVTRTQSLARQVVAAAQRR